MKSKNEIDEMVRKFAKEQVYYSRVNKIRKKVKAAINIIIVILTFITGYFIITLRGEIALIIVIVLFIISIYLAKSQERITMYLIRKSKT